MKRMYAQWMCAVGASALVGCSTPEGTPTQEQLEAKQALVVFHTPTAVKTLSLKSSSSSTREQLRQRVDGFFPAACLDGDRDSDGVPDSLDKDEVTRSSGIESTPEGQAARLCRVCNRGPGKFGDFRLRIRDNEARLDRGRVASRADGRLEVPSPDGTVVILFDASTEIKGDPTPGSEIRAEGVLVSGKTVTAKKLEVLCPGPGTVSDSEVPSEAQSVSDDDNTCDDKGREVEMKDDDDCGKDDDDSDDDDSDDDDDDSNDDSGHDSNDDNSDDSSAPDGGIG